jgi:hypothetical protein
MPIASRFARPAVLAAMAAALLVPATRANAMPREACVAQREAFIDLMLKDAGYFASIGDWGMFNMCMTAVNRELISIETRA